MKTSLFSALVSAAALTGFYASATPLPTILGPITFKWTLTTTNLVDSPKYPEPGKTTVTGSGFAKATTTVQVLTSSDKATPNFGNAGILGLLANSFNMNFPAGTKLLTDSSGEVFVVDKTGKNQIIDSSAVSTVLKATSSDSISSGVETDTTAVKFSSTNSTRVQTHSGSAFITVNYDDSAMPTTTDGTKTIFQFIGISTSSSKSTQTITTNDVVKGSDSFTLHGFGSGTIRGKNYLIQGTIIGTPSGTETLPNNRNSVASRIAW